MTLDSPFQTEVCYDLYGKSTATHKITMDGISRPRTQKTEGDLSGKSDGCLWTKSNGEVIFSTSITKDFYLVLLPGPINEGYKCYG